MPTRKMTSDTEEITLQLGDLQIRRRRQGAAARAKAAEQHAAPAASKDAAPAASKAAAPAASNDAAPAASKDAAPAASTRTEVEILRSPPPVLEAEPQTLPRNYYVVYACKAQPGLVGIHYTDWYTFKKKLPGQQLGNARSGKKFTEPSLAVDYFRAHNSTVDPIIYKY